MGSEPGTTGWAGLRVREPDCFFCYLLASPAEHSELLLP